MDLEGSFGTPNWYTGRLQIMPKIAPRLERRGGKYYIRAKVPADLRHLLGKREYHYSLKTTESEARQRVHLESLKIDSAIAAARRRKEARPVIVLSRAECEYLALDWFSKKEATRAGAVDPGGPLIGLDDDEARAAKTDAEYWVHALSNSENLEGATTVGSTIRTILRQQGIEIDPRSEAYRSLHEVFRSSRHSVHA